MKSKKLSQPLLSVLCETNEVNEVYRYILEKGSRKYLCPKCHKKRFVIYLDMEDENIISKHVGRCDREISCGYHFTPKMFFENIGKGYNPIIKNQYKTKEKATSFHKKIQLKQSLLNNNNNFIKYLKSIFPIEKVDTIIRQYNIGTATFWNNATVFWQLDEIEKVRSGKMIIYSQNGKRTKYINWVHSYQIKQELIKDFNLNQCLFGLHLIPQNNKPIAIVESEKTACIMSILFDKYLWLAAGSLNGITEKKMKPIKNRKIILYPDLGISNKDETPYQKWKLRSNQLSKNGYDISTSFLLENNATKAQKLEGYDIADYFLASQNNPLIIQNKQDENLSKLLNKNKNLKTLIGYFDLEIIRNTNKASEC